MLKVIVELSPPDTKIEIITLSNDVKNEIKDAEIIENLIYSKVITKKARDLLAPSDRATLS
jgi:hypothetical protein